MSNPQQVFSMSLSTKRAVLGGWFVFFTVTGVLVSVGGFWYQILNQDPIYVAIGWLMIVIGVFPMFTVGERI